MHASTMRKIYSGALVSLAAFVAAACGDARIGKLSAGITRDSALKVINEGAPGDSLARVYKLSLIHISEPTRH